MLDALAEHFPAESTWTHPEGGLFLWATLPDYIDTTDLLARALQDERRVRAGPRGVPRRARRLVDAAELLRRGRRRRSVEGVRRIGEVVSEQVALYGTLTGAGPRPPPRASKPAPPPANVLHLPRREPGSGSSAGER